MADINVRELPRNDQGVLATGALAFIASFFPYYGVSVHTLGVNGSSSTSAWHSYATLALLLVIAATAVAAVQVFARESLPTTGVSWNMIVLALSAIGTLLLVIRSFTLDSGSVGGFDYGLRWGAYVLMVVCLAQTVFAYLRVRETGEPMPWAHRPAANPPGA